MDGKVDTYWSIRPSFNVCNFCHCERLDETRSVYLFFSLLFDVFGRESSASNMACKS